MKRIPPAAILLASTLAALAACGRSSDSGPPSVRLGDSVCAQCNMIISDQRWATATIVSGPRGPEPRLFDDFNCQVNYENDHPDLDVVARWSHGHATRQWIRTGDARFLLSPNLRTPMASRVAAFVSPDNADAAQAQLTGEVMGFEQAWQQLGAAATAHGTAEGTPEHDHGEHTDGP